MSYQVSTMLLLICIICLMQYSFGNYPVCDGENVGERLGQLIDDHIDRLMTQRLPNWGWVSTPKVVLAFQLTKQRSFFGRNKTLETMKEELANEVNTTSIGKLALYSMAIQASCENPNSYNGINVIQHIKNKLPHQWFYNGSAQQVPENGWYQYGLAIQALCVNGEEVPGDEIRKVTQGHISSGINVFHSIDNTAQMVLALQCLKMQNATEEINQTLTKALMFMKSQVRQIRNLVWIGNKYSTPASLLALSAAEGYQQSSSWLCVNATKSIANGLRKTEPEGALSQRLPALGGKSTLSLRNNWTCEDTEPIPNGYQPTFDPTAGTECSTLLTHQLNPGTISVVDLISVRLSVHTSINAPFTDPYNYSILVEEVEKGNTLLQVMTQAKCNEQLRFEAVPSSYGLSVASINGVRRDRSARQFWSHVDAMTGRWLPLVISQYVPKPDEHILFQLKTY